MLVTIYTIFAIWAIVTSTVAVQLKFIIKGNETIWIRIEGKGINNTFNLGGGFEKTVNVPNDWAGKVWGQTGCNLKTNQCDTGSGKKPTSLGLIQLNGYGYQDYYKISLVNGFNVMMAIQPSGGYGNCKKTACQERLNDICPVELKVTKNNVVIGCNSACNTFNTSQYCCTGDYGTVGTCIPPSWPTNFANFFKENCPNASSYNFDSSPISFTCNAISYTITLGG